MRLPWRRPRGRHAAPPARRMARRAERALSPTAAGSPMPSSTRVLPAQPPSAAGSPLPSPAPAPPAQRSTPAATWSDTAPFAVSASESPTEDKPVRLGFTDGTEIHLDASSPTALELRAVADVLFVGRDYPA